MDKDDDNKKVVDDIDYILIWRIEDMLDIELIDFYFDEIVIDWDLDDKIDMLDKMIYFNWSDFDWYIKMMKLDDDHNTDFLRWVDVWYLEELINESCFIVDLFDWKNLLVQQEN